MTDRVGEPAPGRRAIFIASCFLFGVAMTALAASPALGQIFVPPPTEPSSLVDPTGRSGQPPGPLKEEFQRPQPPPSPVLPIVAPTPEGAAPEKAGGLGGRPIAA